MVSGPAAFSLQSGSRICRIFLVGRDERNNRLDLGHFGAYPDFSPAVSLWFLIRIAIGRQSRCVFEVKLRTVAGVFL